MNDCVLIENLIVHSIVGLHEWEQQLPRKLLLDLELGMDMHRAASSDAMADGVDYAAVCAQVAEICQTTHYRLLETLAEHLARELLRTFARIDSVQLTIRKPGAVSAARSVGVRIRRQREAGPRNQ